MMMVSRIKNLETIFLERYSTPQTVERFIEQ